MPLSLPILFAGPVAAMVLQSASNTSAPVELWAGHQVAFGQREIPFQGRVTTRTDTLVLARVRREDDRFVLEQTACAVRFGEVAGVRVSMDARHLPVATTSFRMRADGETFMSRSEVGWGDEDIDDDGNPGMTISVDAPVCAGDLYVKNASSTNAYGSFTADGKFVGRAKVAVSQQVLGARGKCLSVVARDSDEVVRGPFAFVPVPAGTSCASLIRSGWPIDAESEE